MEDVEGECEERVESLNLLGIKIIFFSDAKNKSKNFRWDLKQLI